MRLAIVGSRDFPDLEQVRRYVDDLPTDTVVVTGGAEGVDALVERAARARGLTVVVVWPQADVYAPTVAPRERNRGIVAECDELVAFWGPVISAGTSHVVSLAAHAGKLRGVIRPRILA